MKSQLYRLAATFFLLQLCTSTMAQGDAYIRDTLADTGVEPYTGSGPIYLSPDIWVRNEPDPNFSPYPFPTNSPSWAPATHQNPEYRDSKTSRPNYIYVQVHNRGSTPTTGNERLRLYQAKASTGLSWPAAWVDNMDSACGQSLLHGIEITKPRQNALNVSQAEFDRYVDAVSEISTNPTLQYSDGVQYWQKQQSVHVDPGNPEHGNPSFLPWHREMINRYEERLKEYDPLVTLLYWDWTQNLESVINRGFIGVSDGTFNFGGVPLQRRVGEQFCTFDSDATLLSSTYDDYADFSERVENWQRNHDCGHVFIGGSSNPSGQMSSTATAAQDPIFFMHHANVDRIWATWQREDASPALLDPISSYGADSSSSFINATMSPWDGSTITMPWQGASTTSKTSKNRSVVYPPVYDTAPLNIPQLQPGESVIVEVPWYPPNVNSFNCAGQSGHFCMLARIETQVNAPFGMGTPEGVNVVTNTRNNNNIAWKNLTIVDNEIEPLFLISGTSLHNFFKETHFFHLRLVDRTEKRRFLLHEFADIALIFPEEILKRIMSNKEVLRDIEIADIKGFDQPVLQVVGKQPSLKLLMKGNERINVQFAVRLKDERLTEALLQEPFHFDIEQALDLPGDFVGLKSQNAGDIGGVRFTIDYANMLEKQEAEKGGIRLADLTVRLSNELQDRRLELIPNQEATTHLSPGEPVMLNVAPDFDGQSMLSLSVKVDGRELDMGGRKTLDEERLSFETPGVYRIEVEGLSEEGEIIRRELRVLVSENIPPTVVIAESEENIKLKVGEQVTITTQTTAAFKRSVKEVTLHIKEGTSLIGGMNLVKSDSYPAVDSKDGEGPHEFTFEAEKPGIYMLQVGVLDDNGIQGVSNHVMVMVNE